MIEQFALTTDTRYFNEKECNTVREMKVDWAALHSAFQSSMPEVRCFLSLEEGTVLKMLPGDPKLAVVRSQPSRYIPVETVPSRIQYQWLDEFIASIETEETRTRFQAAANGKGAFRRFKDILLTMPEERRRWFEHRDQKMRERIVEWIREQAIVPMNDPPWLDEEGPAFQVLPNEVHDIDALRAVVATWAMSHEDAKQLADDSVNALIDDLASRFRIRELPMQISERAARRVASEEGSGLDHDDHLDLERDQHLPLRAG
jgi:hypothetical protein